MVLKEVIFKSFPYLEDVVVLKEVIFNTFYFRRVCWSGNSLFITVLLLVGVVVLKEEIFNSFHI